MLEIVLWIIGLYAAFLVVLVILAKVVNGIDAACLAWHRWRDPTNPLYKLPGAVDHQSPPGPTPRLPPLSFPAGAILAALLSTSAIAMDYTRIPADIASKNVIWADDLAARPWTYVLRADIYDNWAPAKMPGSVNKHWGPPTEPWKGMCLLGMKCPD